MSDRGQKEIITKEADLLASSVKKTKGSKSIEEIMDDVMMDKGADDGEKSNDNSKDNSPDEESNAMTNVAHKEAVIIFELG